MAYDKAALQVAIENLADSVAMGSIDLDGRNCEALAANIKDAAPDLAGDLEGSTADEEALSEDLAAFIGEYIQDPAFAKAAVAQNLSMFWENYKLKLQEQE